jgi:hypothetical protein
MAKLIIKRRYATIPNDLLNDSSITLKAKGLFGYIQSKPDGWDFSAERIASQLREGLPAIMSSLKELEAKGYLYRERYINELGYRMARYHLYDIPTFDRPTAENLHRGFPHEENAYAVKPSGYIKKDSSNQENSLKQSYDFEKFWDAYGKKVDRVKCEKAWNKLSKEEIEKINTTVELYVKSKSDIQFRKNPLSYLNGKCFNDELPGNGNNQNNNIPLDNRPIIPEQWQ